jgi:AcrR family transcriptional regulator
VGLSGSALSDWDPVLSAALELAEGGYEAVRLDEIAYRAGVTRRDLRQTFRSKDHILQEATLLWSQGLRAFALDGQFEGVTAAERVTEVLVKATLYSARHARVVAALIRAWCNKDQSPLTLDAHVWEPTVSIVRDAIRPPLSAEAANKVGRVLHLVWCALLQRWLYNGETVEGICSEIADSAHLLLDGLESAPPRLRVISGTGLD